MTPLTLQQVFNGAWERAKHKVRCTLPDNFRCRYRAENIPPCFIGVSIPDELYDDNFEGKGIAALATDWLPELFAGIDPEVLSDLQSVHDDVPIDMWESELRIFAQEHELEVPA